MIDDSHPASHLVVIATIVAECLRDCRVALTGRLAMTFISGNLFPPKSSEGTFVGWPFSDVIP